MPSASTKFSFIRRTSLKARTSRRRRAPLSRSRNRFEVSFCSPTGPAPCPRRPAPSLSRAARASRFLEWLSASGIFRLVLPVEKIPRHRIARARHVAFGEYHLEEMRLRHRRAEHLGAAVEVDAPDAAEALVEPLRVERADLLPVAVEALGPVVERDRVVPAQVLDVEHLEPGALHLDDGVGEARDPAAGEHVLADEVVGLVAADVADEVDQAYAAFLQQPGVRPDQLAELVAPGVLEAADRHHLVELALLGPEVALRLDRVGEAEALYRAPRVLGLRAGGVDAGDARAVALRGVDQEAAEAAADVDHLVARPEQHLACYVVRFVPLRFLQRVRLVGPVRAGVEHQRVVEPELVELGVERVVELGVVPGAPPARVVVEQLVRVVEQPQQAVGAVEAALQAGGHRPAEVALDVDVAVEIGLQQADVAEQRRAPVGARVAEDERERGLARGLAVLAAREAHCKRDARAFLDLAQRVLHYGSHSADS